MWYLVARVGGKFLALGFQEVYVMCVIIFTGFNGHVYLGDTYVLGYISVKCLYILR